MGVSYHSEGSAGGPLTADTPSYSREYTASCIVTSAMDRMKQKEEQKRTLNLNELKDKEEVKLQEEASEGTMEDEISAYLPARRFHSRNTSRKGSISVKNSICDEFIDCNASEELSSSCEKKEDLSQEATDD